MLLEVDRIKATPEAQPRVSLHYPTVEEYAEALRGSAEFPPVVVFHDGAEYWLADGFHRLEAYKKEDRTKIPVEIRNGSKRDAILFSVGANARHGLPRTNEDKRRAVMVLLQDAEWGKRSDKWVGEQAGVTCQFVGKLRKAPGVNGLPVSERQGRDGKSYALPEKRAKSEPPREVTAAEPAEANAAEAQPESSEQAMRGEPTRQASAQPAIRAVPAAPSNDDPKRGCASLSERDAVEAWVEQGAMLYGRFGEGAREYMRTAWDKRLAKLEGY